MTLNYGCLLFCFGIINFFSRVALMRAEIMQADLGSNPSGKIIKINSFHLFSGNIIY
jgi:hypothetical protein